MNNTDIEKIWEFAGFYQGVGYHWDFGNKEAHWYRPDGNVCLDRGVKGRLPELNMTNLFKWVVEPKLDGYVIEKQVYWDNVYVLVTYKEKQGEAEAKTALEALAMAVSKVIGDSDESS